MPGQIGKRTRISGRNASRESESALGRLPAARSSLAFERFHSLRESKGYALGESEPFGVVARPIGVMIESEVQDDNRYCCSTTIH